jgi:diguanylate cyclase (GGDEF)-like protein/PAS domain S-box-containing protein
MIDMDFLLPRVLSYINEGIVILDQDLGITYWNSTMEKLTGKKQNDVLGQSVVKAVPRLDKPFFRRTAMKVLEGTPAFFSAAMHRNIVGTGSQVNLKMNRITCDNTTAVLLEFIDVTGQFHQIHQLRSYVDRLSQLNNELKRKEKVIEKLAYYDQLTGVANRALFDKFADRYLNRARENGTMLALMFVDVNEFKQINDTYGHNTGDKVMTRVASLLTESTRKNDIVCRYGGDEFLVLIPDIRERSDLPRIVARIYENKKRQIHQDGYEIRLSLSIGISLYPADGETIEALVEQADRFMYADKNESR